ncbi:fungal-specific transcription factor domain-containing protein [Dactylonectria estremocensis]|uniref:Fungal-specific transcription factor domain-containing protein n=1 Tax=Dactylonectria estremocensis TaxID=1079267 RepID=A0A9P9DKU6_9HYPO|nr:fungal-specific transcription factor domain-containing protein [Dactylonectria estremocensis]
MHDVSRAPNSCRTCRQKRVRCDRLLPTCQRCVGLKLRCLGYDRSKALVWTNSIASRGKMMGRTTFEVERLHQVLTPDLCCHPSPVAQARPRGKFVQPFPLDATVSRSLIEPGLQDLPADCRNYIRYFDQELSRECVVYNKPADNPFLSLMPLMSRNRALYHIMISISAFHFNHRILIRNFQLPSRENKLPLDSPELWSSTGDLCRQTTQLNPSDALRTALLHKQKALQHLKRELQDYSNENSNAVIATVVLFICMDVVEFGGRGWRHHLRAAEQMIQSRKNLLGDEDSESRAWLTYFDTACTTFGILGATLTRASISSTQASPIINTSYMEALRQSENQTWVGCPAELLHLLSAMNSLRSIPQAGVDRPRMAQELCDGLTRFSPSCWAKQFPDQQHRQSRFHLAYAYKAAVEVYASYLFGGSINQHYLSPSYVRQLVQPAICHMLAIPPDDFHLKSLVWPAFVLGAETQEMELRKILRTLFQHIWVMSCCYNARSAADMLEAIWGRDSSECADKSWLDYVWNQEESWLFL